MRVVGPAIAHAVALGTNPVGQDVLRFVLTQDLEQAGALAARRSITAAVYAWAVPTEMPKPAAI